MSPTRSALENYWSAVRSPRYSLSFAFPLFVAYEALAFFLSRYEMAGVRNGADVLLKSLFIALGGEDGLAALGVLLVGGSAALVWQDVRRSGRIQSRYFVAMAAEAIAYALVFGVVAGTLTALLLPTIALVGHDPGLALGRSASLSFPAQLMISLGAGIYEELLFRVLLVSGLSLLAAKVFRWSRASSSAFAIIVAALIFSAFHYLGPYGEPVRLGSFTFRTIAGLLFSGLYVSRGFGITAWTHALYDVFLAM